MNGKVKIVKDSKKRTILMIPVITVIDYQGNETTDALAFFETANGDWRKRPCYEYMGFKSIVVTKKQYLNHLKKYATDESHLKGFRLVEALGLPKPSKQKKKVKLNEIGEQ